MKRILFTALLLSGAAVADNHLPPGVDPDAICTHDVVYTIYDEDGNVMDRTKYIRNWELDCITSTRLKYETIRKLVNDGEAQFEALIGGQ